MNVPKPKGGISSVVIWALLAIVLYIGAVGPIVRIASSRGPMSPGAEQVLGIVYAPLVFTAERVPGARQLLASYLDLWMPTRVRITPNACVNNLRQIDGAKEQWALENKKSAGSPAIQSQVDQYIKGGTPVCPQGGKYQYNVIDQMPTCSIAGHSI